MNRFETTLTEKVGALLGDRWKAEAPKGWGVILATHENGSSVSLFISGEDGRRNATDDDAANYAQRLISKLRGEVPKYTPEWASKAREALAEVDECDACGAEKFEPCNWPCTAYQQALEEDRDRANL